MSNEKSEAASVPVTPQAHAAALAASQAATQAPQPASAAKPAGRQPIPVPARDQALAGALPQWDLVPPMQFVRR